MFSYEDVDDAVFAAWARDTAAQDDETPWDAIYRVYDYGEGADPRTMRDEMTRYERGLALLAHARLIHTSRYRLGLGRGMVAELRERAPDSAIVTRPAGWLAMDACERAYALVARGEDAR